MQPLVSVIVPVYQVSDYVERCLVSVMKQTYPHIECVLVDDATEDDSIEKCNSLIKHYQGPIQFKIIHHEQNRGLSVARNTGTNAATGDYLYYLDSDDEIMPGCIEKLVSYVLEDNRIELVQGRYLRKDDGKDELGKSDEVWIWNNEEARNQFLHWRTLNCAAWNKLLKKAFIIDNRLYFREGASNEDFLWTFYLIKYLNNAQLCKDITYYYHIRPNSILNDGNITKIGQSYVDIYEEMLHNLTQNEEVSELKGLQTTFCVALGRYFRCVPDLRSVLELYKKQAKQYGCWSVYVTLSTVAFASRFGNPLSVLRKLNDLRLKSKKP